MSLSLTCLQTLKGKFFPAWKFQLYPKFAGEEFLYRLSPQNPVLWINFRGTGKNPGIRLELGKADGFPEKVNCRGYSRWSAGSTGAGNSLDPILDPIQEITCSLVIGIFPSGWVLVFPSCGGYLFFLGDSVLLLLVSPKVPP